MKIYILSYTHNEHGNVLSYHATKRRAEFAFNEAKEVEEKQGFEVDGCDIRLVCCGKSKRDVIKFLNHWTPSTDNG